MAASIFGPLAEANINVDMIVQNLSSDGKRTDMTFTVQESELDRGARRAQVAAQGASATSTSIAPPTWPRFP